MLVVLLFSRRLFVCFIFDVYYLYFVGGFGDDDFFLCNERYDFKLNIWIKMVLMKEKRGCVCGLCFNNKIYIFGGIVDVFFRYVSVSGEVYDIVLDEWYVIVLMRVFRFYVSVVFLRD